jgi:predicted transcriptional regulator
MIICPYCATENIEGEDECAQCGQPLADVHIPPPANEVERSLRWDRINVLSPKWPISVAPTAPMREVLKLMVERKIGCVIIEENNRPLGIFSERDALLKLNTAAAELSDRPVSEFMTPKPQTLDVNARLAFAVQRMDMGAYRHLPIVDTGGELVGIISARDIMRHLMESLAT